MDRDKSGPGLGAASPWAGLGQVQGASVAEGGGEERDYTLCFAPLLSPLLPTLAALCIPCSPTPRAYRWR